MVEAAVLVAFLAFIASTLWWPRPVVRVVSALLLGGIVTMFVTPGSGLLTALFVAAAVALAAAWLPQRVHRRVCFMVLTLVLLVYVITLLMFLAPGNPFRQEKQANEQV